MANPGLDRLGKLGERGSDWQQAWRLGSEFVVAAADVLHEREPGDMTRAVRSVPVDSAVAR